MICSVHFVKHVTIIIRIGLLDLRFCIRIKDRVLDSAAFPFLTGLQFGSRAAGDRRVEDPTEQHEHKVDQDTRCGDKEGSETDQVVVVDPAVATATTVKLPIDAASIK